MSNCEGTRVRPCGWAMLRTPAVEAALGGVIKRLSKGKSKL
jgi:hypothetical protein